MNRMHCTLSGVILLTLLGGAVAWAAGDKSGGIPTGKWVGEGVFTVHKWQKATGDQPARPDAYEHGRYPARLTIEQTRYGDQDAYRVEIFSERGRTEHLEGDRTHIVVVLVQRKTFGDADGPVEYAGVELGVVTDASPMKVDKNEGVYPIVTCVREGEQVVLHLTYQREFADVITFHGERATKCGVLAGDDGVVQWSEQFKKQ